MPQPGRSHSSWFLFWWTWERQRASCHASCVLSLPARPGPTPVWRSRRPTPVALGVPMGSCYKGNEARAPARGSCSLLASHFSHERVLTDLAGSRAQWPARSRAASPGGSVLFAAGHNRAPLLPGRARLRRRRGAAPRPGRRHRRRLVVPLDDEVLRSAARTAGAAQQQLVFRHACVQAGAAASVPGGAGPPRSLLAALLACPAPC